MPSIITLATDSKPQVILITPASALADEVRRFLTENNLEVILVDPGQIEENGEELGKQLPPQPYKTIWIYGFSDTRERAFSPTIRFLQSRPEVKVVITRRTTPFEVDKTISPGLNEQIKAEQNFFEQIIYLSSTQLIIGQDVMLATDEVIYPLKFCLEGLKKNLLIDPQTEWYLQTTKSFFETIKKQLLKPHSESSVIVRGEMKTSSWWVALIKDLYIKYFKTSLKVVRLVARSLSPSESYDVVCQTHDDVAAVIDQKVRSLPSRLNKLDGFDETTLSKAKVFPGPTKRRSTHASATQPPFKTPIESSLGGEKASRNEKREALGVENQVKDRKRPLGRQKADDDGLEQELQRLFTKNRSQYKSVRSEGRVKTTKKVLRKSKRKKAMFFGGLGVVLAGVGIGASLIVMQVTMSLARKELVGFFEGYAGEEITRVDESSFSSMDKLNKQLKFWRKILGEVLFEEAASLLAIFKVLTEVDQEVATTSQSIQTIYGLVVSGGLGLGDEVFQLSSSAQQAYDKLSQLQSEISGFGSDFLSEEKQEVIKKVEKRVVEHKKRLMIATQLQSFLPKFLGEEEKRVYVFLLQNNLELRPTGGFIQAVALLTFDKGSLIDSRVFSVYEIDNKLAGITQPPDEVKQYLGESRWYLRDSNWNPNFPQTAQRVSWFVKESLGIPVDGVIAANLTLFKQLLAATGPMDIPEYNEVVTDKNLLERVEFHSENSLLKGQDESEDYLVILLRKLLTRLKVLPQDQVLDTISVLGDALEANQLFLSLPKREENSTLSELGWEGVIVSPDCPAQFSRVPCEVNSIYQVDANVGLNKVNNYIYRQVTQNIELLENMVRHQRVVVYQNKARSDNWPQGEYRVYVRFFVDLKSQLESVKLNNNNVPLEYVKSYSQENKQVYGMLIKVPREEVVTLELSYLVPLKNSLPFSYIFFDQKQPGVTNESRQIKITYPSEYQPQLIAPMAGVEEQVISFEDSSSHSFVGASFD